MVLRAIGWSQQDMAEKGDWCTLSFDSFLLSGLRLCMFSSHRNCKTLTDLRHWPWPEDKQVIQLKNILHRFEYVTFRKHFLDQILLLFLLHIYICQCKCVYIGKGLVIYRVSQEEVLWEYLLDTFPASNLLAQARLKFGTFHLMLS